ncbi:MAG: Holliday junction branch migration protein RuvA [Clostridia bacterium]|nr:Holliday junction branch migration protein RuvA [Clostridia bacterium]
MYAYLNGTVAQKLIDKIYLDVNGVGFEVFCSQNTLDSLVQGETRLVYTYLYLAEGVMNLYGFADLAEKDMFRQLIGVTRVGPKLALSVLSRMKPQDITNAVITDNPAAFDGVSGMGRKTAQRVILELKGKISEGETLPVGPSGPTESDFYSDAIAALIALGYDGLSASRAVTSVKDAQSAEDMIRKALRFLSKQ